MTSSMSRRDVLRAIGIAAGTAPVLLGQQKPPERTTSPEEYMARLETFYSETDSRPEFVSVAHECRDCGAD